MVAGRRLLITGLAASGLAASAANESRAQGPVQLRQTVTRPPMTDNSAIDVIGIRPGMGLDEVRRILIAEYGEGLNQAETSMTLQGRGISVMSQRFVVRLDHGKQDDEISVWFSPPTLGNTVVAIARNLRFPDFMRAPSLSDLRQQLVAKYGTPSEVRGIQNRNNSLFWSFGATGRSSVLQCLRTSCPTTGDLSFNTPWIYREVVDSGVHLAAMAETPAYSGEIKALGLRVRVDDVLGKALGIEAGITQLQQAIDELVQRAQGSQQRPRL